MADTWFPCSPASRICTHCLGSDTFPRDLACQESSAIMELQCFWNLDTLKNHLEVCGNAVCWVPSPESLIPQVWSGGVRMCNTFQVMPKLLIWGPSFEWSNLSGDDCGSRGELFSWAHRGGIVLRISGEAEVVYDGAWNTASLVAADIVPSASW